MQSGGEGVDGYLTVGGRMTAACECEAPRRPRRRQGQIGRRRGAGGLTGVRGRCARRRAAEIGTIGGCGWRASDAPTLRSGGGRPRRSDRPAGGVAGRRPDRVVAVPPAAGGVSRGGRGRGGWAAAAEHRRRPRCAPAAAAAAVAARPTRTTLVPCRPAASRGHGDQPAGEVASRDAVARQGVKITRRKPPSGREAKGSALGGGGGGGSGGWRRGNRCRGGGGCKPESERRYTAR